MYRYDEDEDNKDEEVKADGESVCVRALSTA